MDSKIHTETPETDRNSEYSSHLTSPSLASTTTGLLNNKAFVYIDGANFYRNLKEIGLASMNFQFRKFLENLLDGRRLAGIRYYIGQVRKHLGDEKSKELYKHQQIFFEKLRTRGIYIVKGHIRQIGSVFTEKGVDVRLAIDLIEGAYENRYDEAILISSDGDLAPAVEMVNNKNKQISIIGFAHKPCYALIQKANKYISLRKSDLEMFG